VFLGENMWISLVSTSSGGVLSVRCPMALQKSSKNSFPGSL